jgi:hypothetical protein
MWQKIMSLYHITVIFEMPKDHVIFLEKKNHPNQLVHAERSKAANIGAFSSFQWLLRGFNRKLRQ